LLGHAANVARAGRETPGTLRRVVPAHHPDLHLDAKSPLNRALSHGGVISQQIGTPFAVSYA
jgi:hypothetical protein